MNKNARSSLFFFFLFNLPSSPNECHGTANIDIIVKQLNKETDLCNGIIKSAKKRKRNKPSNSNSKEITATPANSAKNMLMCRSYSNKINYNAIEGLFEDY